MTLNWRDNAVLKVRQDSVAYSHNLADQMVPIVSKLTNLVVVLENSGSVKETYSSTSPWYFSIWVLIDVLLAGYVGFQFFDESQDIVQGVGYRFAIIAVLNTVFLNLYATQHVIAAFIFSILLSSSVSHVYYTLRANFYVISVFDGLFVHLPFSLWHAFAVTLMFDSGFAAFTDGIKAEGPGFIVKTAVVVSEIFLATTAVGYGFVSRRGDVAGAFVVSAFLFGIYLHQQDPLIHWIALVGALVADVAVLKSLYFTFYDNSGVIVLDERTPIVAT